MSQLDMNTLQWLFFGGILLLALVAALLALLPPLRRIRQVADSDRRALNIAIYEQRLQEPEQDVDEAGLRLIEDAGSKTVPAVENGKPLSWPLVVLLVLIVPVVALGLYLRGDGWRLIGSNAAHPPVSYVLHRLQARTQAEPGSAEAWLVLARTYRSLQRNQDAAMAYARANALDSHNATALAEQGELLANNADGDMSGRPLALFHQALSVDPKQTKALFYLGLWAYLHKDRDHALNYWQALALQPLPSALAKVLHDKIQQIGGQWPSPAKGSLRIILKLTLQPGLRKRLPANGVLFVYAKLPQGAPRPLAAVRSKDLSFPQTVYLSDADAVMGQQLSSFKRWLVTARISGSGDALARSGDMVGSKLVTEAMARAGTVQINIDNIKP